jgi:hypothetical protein
MSVRTDYRVAAPAQEWTYAVGKGHLAIHLHGDAKNGFYSTGVFLDPRGIVRVYRQIDHTNLTYIADGRSHDRSWNRYWSDRTINRLARALITDVLNEEFGL